MTAQDKGAHDLDQLAVDQFRQVLVLWFRAHGRDLPWRRTRDPYAILLSEVLLQRTQASQVAAHFDSIISAIPTITSLAGASEQDIRVILAPLGLAKRAGTLRAMAVDIIEHYDGSVPSNVNSLMALPGVGRYIASATACFAFGAKTPVLDANVIRILSRYFAVASAIKRPRYDNRLWSAAADILPESDYVDFNRALIDFASLVCTGRRPGCLDCPLRSTCRNAVDALTRLSET